MSDVAFGRMRFGYEADTIGNVNARILQAGPPTRIGGKAKALRNAVLAGIQTRSTVIALVDARAGEVRDLEQDVREILAQSRERSADVRVAIGLAIQEIEIWMLADPQAREAAFGSALSGQPFPDDLEGAPDLKALWLERAGQATPPDGVDHDLHRDNQRNAAWQAMRPDVVTHACPRGFGPFAAAVLGVLPWGQE